MNAHKLIRKTPFNSFYCNRTEIKCMVFFKDGEVLATHKSGWLSTFSNNIGNSALEQLEFIVKRVPDLKLNKCFVIKDTVYINVNHLNGFSVNHNVKSYSSPLADHFYDTISFETSDRYKTKPQIHTFNLTGTLKTVINDTGRKVEKLHEFFNNNKIVISESGVEKLFNIKDELIDTINKL